MSDLRLTENILKRKKLKAINRKLSPPWIKQKINEKQCIKLYKNG